MKKQKNKKIKLKKSYKKAAIILLIVLLLFSLSFLYKEFFIEKYIDEKQLEYSGVNMPNISYSIRLIPNLVYDVEFLEEKEGYFASLIDSISVEFVNEFKGEQDAVFEGEYSITYSLKGMTAGVDEPVVAWEKQFIQIPQKTFSVTKKSKGFKVQEKFDIDYNFYNDFSDQVTELIDFETDNYLNVDMDINYTITSEAGVIEETIKPGLIIPLGKDYFKIEKVGIETKNSEIYETIKVLAPIDYRMTALYIAICLVSLILLIVVIRDTAEPDMKDLKRRHIKKIFKQYGKRLVAIEQDMLRNTKSRNVVHSINDMEKISDELERPIFYIYKDDLSDISELFILDGEEAFICNIEPK